MMAAAKRGAKRLELLRFQVDGHASVAHMLGSHTHGTASAHAAVLPCPPLLAEAFHAALLVGVRRLVPAVAVERTVVRAVGNAAVVPPIAGVAPTRAVDAFAKLAAVAWTCGVRTVHARIILTTHTLGRLLVAHAVAVGAVVRACHQRAIQSTETLVACTLPSGHIAEAVVGAAFRAQLKRTGLAGPACRAKAYVIHTLAPSVAVVLANGLGTRLALPQWCANTSATVALAVAIAFVRAHLDRAIHPTPAAEARTSAVQTSTISIAVVEADLVLAVPPFPPV